MQVFTRLALCFLLLPATALMVQAQQPTTFQFSAEVTQIVDQNNNFGINVGDLVVGTLVLPANYETISGNAGSAVHDLTKDESSSIAVLVGGHEFSSSQWVQGNDFRERGFYATMYNSLVDQNGGPTCRNTIQINSEVNVFPDQKDVMFSQIGLYFENDDCDFALDVMELPTSINLSDWNRMARLVVGRYEDQDGRDIQLEANITSITAQAESGAVVSGNVFADYNGDCDFNGTDQNLMRRFVKVTPGPYLAATDINGHYSMTLPVGDYDVEVIERELWSQTCPAGPASISLADEDTEVNLDFALEAERLTEAIDVSVMSSRAVPGFDIMYYISVRNIGTLPYSGTLRFTPDGLLTDFSSVPQPDSYDYPTAEWDFVDLAVDQRMEIHVTMKVPADEGLLGTIICAVIESEQENDGSDDLLRKDSDEICQEVRGSFDPNDIQVFSGERNADGSILPEDKVLTYLIRFQNEGNEDAITVRVVDQLSEFHNIEKIRLGAASHDFSFDFTNDGALEWTFNDIYLKPKSVDEVGSQGFLKFEVYLKDELATGTEIPNSAAIYFDFNSPVITNTVVSRIAGTTTSVDYDLDDASISVFPNPTSDKVTIRFEEPLNDAAESFVTVRNALGEALMTQKLNSAGTVLSLDELSAGSYWLAITTPGSTIVKPINVVR